MSKRLLKKLQTAQSRYDNVICEAEAKIESMIDFEFSICYMAGDGFVVLDVDSDNVAPLDACLKIIDAKKRLTLEIHEELAI